MLVEADQEACSYSHFFKSAFLCLGRKKGRHGPLVRRITFFLAWRGGPAVQ